jgi:thiol-disulfide isomerase/thioredoxin
MGLTLAQKPAKTPIGNTEYSGKFDAELIPDTRQLSRLEIKRVDNPAGYKFARPIGKDILISAGKIFDLRRPGGNFQIALLEPAKVSPSVCIDLNTDVTFGDDECFVMTTAQNNPNDFEYTLKLPIKTPLFKTLPIFLRYRRSSVSSQLQSGDPLLMQSLLGYATGRVKLKNRSVLVQYQINAADGTASTKDGLMGMDIDNDGKIKNEPFSLETSAAMNDEIVFRLGDLYLSTSRLDTVNNQIVLRERDAKEYRRIELEIGKPMPDFSFIDFDNKKRALADFRGKYLLVDFWGLWCVDCRREIPYQFEAYKRFRARGFEILGMDTYEKMEQVKPVLQKSGIIWTQAQFDSIKGLVESSYRIQEYPSAILLGPDGKVLVLDQNLLRADELLKTLDRILPQ